MAYHKFARSASTEHTQQKDRRRSQARDSEYKRSHGSSAKDLTLSNHLPPDFGLRIH